MSQSFELSGSNYKELLSHMAFYGLAAIIEQMKPDYQIRLTWTRGVNPKPEIYIVNDTFKSIEDEIGRLVQSHAKSHTNDENNWIFKQLGNQSLMSPRIGKLKNNNDWKKLQDARHEVLDDLTENHTYLDLRLLWTLGEPRYWPLSGNEMNQDAASCRFDMQPRNRGNTLISTKLKPLAQSVGQREVSNIVSGLQGVKIKDEIGSNRSNSRTATGFRGPGPTDNAVAWCAIWGISQFALTQRTKIRASTSGFLSHKRGRYFYVPVWYSLWSPSRLRTILASGQLRSFAEAQVASRDNEQGVPETAQQWLAARGVEAVVLFPYNQFGSRDAPEYRAGVGQLYSVA
jgi:CRISPR-associated protein Csb3